MKENVEFKHFQSIASLADPALVSSNVGTIRTSDGKFYSIRSHKHRLKGKNNLAKMNKYYGNFLLKKQILVRDWPCDRIV